MCQTELNESAATSTHAPSLPKRVSSSKYQRARVNLFIPSPERQQLDQLAAEWDCSLVEAARRVIDMGLKGIMQADTEEIPAY